MIEVSPVRGVGIVEPLRLLEESLREGEPVPGALAQRLREAVDAGELEVLAARAQGRVVGVAVLAYRLSISAATPFASVEELYVRPDERRSRTASSSARPTPRRCTAHGVSYVEAQVEDEEAAALYSALGYEPEPAVRVFSRAYLL